MDDLCKSRDFQCKAPANILRIYKYNVNILIYILKMLHNKEVGLRWHWWMMMTVLCVVFRTTFSVLMVLVWWVCIREKFIWTINCRIRSEKCKDKIILQDFVETDIKCPCGGRKWWKENGNKLYHIFYGTPPK